MLTGAPSQRNGGEGGGHLRDQETTLLRFSHQNTNSQMVMESSPGHLNHQAALLACLKTGSLVVLMIICGRRIMTMMEFVGKVLQCQSCPVHQGLMAVEMIYTGNPTGHLVGQYHPSLGHHTDTPCYYHHSRADHRHHFSCADHPPGVCYHLSLGPRILAKGATHYDQPPNHIPGHHLCGVILHMIETKMMLSGFNHPPPPPLLGTLHQTPQDSGHHSPLLPPHPG